MANKLFVFDLDDTLTMTQVLYDGAKIEMWEYMRAVLGDQKAPSLTDFLNLYQKISSEKMAVYGFAPERVMGTMEFVYRAIYERKNLKEHAFLNEEIRDVKKIAQKIFMKESYQKQGLVKNAEQVLRFLKSQGDCLVLFTKGHLTTQATKADTLFGHSEEMKKLFNASVFTEHNKTAKEFSGIAKAGNIDPSFAYSVGNSFKSDILPALQAGFNGIYIPYETWWYEMENSEKDFDKWRDHVMILQDISEIEKKYEDLE